ncbi:YaiO family outer membrane beta-barrel protein [Phenylobacterium sp.]|uniref:YaiO family outer membrane beta-barrel protein n=1 Tax=Phenylobacterium sp. TaxID=1871053 RepID=UPI002F928EAF
MRVFVAAAWVALVPGLAHAQSPSTDYEQGRQLRLAGRPAEAVARLEAAAAANPRDADIWLNLGLAYSDARRFADAERALDEALRLAPDYPDVKLARARVAYFREDFAEAQRRLAATPDSEEARTLGGQISVARRATPRWRLDAFVSRADLTERLPSQTRAGLAATRGLGGGRLATVSGEYARQFGREDAYLEGLVGARRGYLAVGATPDADFRPEWQVRGGLYADPVSVGLEWTAQVGADAAWSRYPTGDVRTVQPSLTLARGDAALITARWINTLDEQDDYRSGYAIRGVFAVMPHLRLSAGWADAPESTQGITTDVRAASVGVAVELGHDLTLRLDAVHEMRPAYDRDELTLGMTRRF